MSECSECSERYSTPVSSYSITGEHWLCLTDHRWECPYLQWEYSCELLTWGPVALHSLLSAQVSWLYQ